MFLFVPPNDTSGEVWGLYIRHFPVFPGKVVFIAMDILKLWIKMNIIYKRVMIIIYNDLKHYDGSNK